MTGAITRRFVAGGLLASAGAAGCSHVLAQSRLSRDPRAGGPIEVSARPIAHFNRAHPQATRFGELEYRGGLIVSSPEQEFGGWSGLVMEPDGTTLFAVSDAGSWLTADVTYQGNRPTGLARAHMGSLRAIGGRPLDDKREQDAESVTLAEGDLARGTLFIGFERLHRVGRFPIRDRQVGPPTGYLKLPAEARGMPRNQGFEALAVLRGGPLRGSLVAFAERYTRGSGYHTGWIWVRGEPQRFQLRDVDEFNITDAAALPDGGLLVLERFFRWTSGVKMRIRRLAQSEVTPGARAVGQVLAEADSAYEIDNMEGMAVHRARTGEIVVSLISDDNFNRFLQRTILLQFTLAGA
jgi:hypothetical protein